MARAIEGLVRLDEGWLRMTGPVLIVEAHRAADVAAAIREVETLTTSRGWHALGFVTYEAGEAFGLDVMSAPGDLPLAWFALFDASTVEAVDTVVASAAYELGPLTPSIGRDQFLSDLGLIREHIASGDSYQVNYTFSLGGAFSGDARGLFADLVAAQRGRYSAFLQLPDHAICSASPELCFQRERVLNPPTTGADAGLWTITTRPMKGTARRGRTAAEDRSAADALHESAKERAENVMVVDMVRNDLGRIATVGSIDVPALFALEAYPNVWQMTSTVTARTNARLDEIFAALFPSASVTGAPKVRTMGIIRALERRPRGVYAGAVGYVAPDGRAQFNVAIRTAVVDERRGTIAFGVGSGVVWDSDPAREYEECLLKGSVLGQRPGRFDLLETMRWTPADGFALLDRHLDRLQESARYFDFPCDIVAVRRALENAMRRLSGPRRVRLLVADDGTVRVEHAALEESAGVLRVALAADPIDPSDVCLFHKTTNRGVYERARRTGYDEVVLWNPSGQITEAATANLVVEIAGRRVTPPVTCGLLPGTLRAELLGAGEIVEAPVTIDQLRVAPRFWLINSLRGWRLATLEPGTPEPGTRN